MTHVLYGVIVAGPHHVRNSAIACACWLAWCLGQGLVRRGQPAGQLIRFTAMFVAIAAAVALSEAAIALAAVGFAFALEGLRLGAGPARRRGNALAFVGLLLGLPSAILLAAS